MIRVFEPRLSLQNKLDVFLALNKNQISGTSKPVSEFEETSKKYFDRDYGVALSNGSVALEVALKSHIVDTKTNKTVSEKKKLGKINRTSFLKTKILNDKFKKKFINLKVGEILIFKNTLVHRSGLSEKNKMRYAAVSFYHDINSQDFIYKKIDQK